MDENSHRLTLEGRQKLHLEGVTEVVSFDEALVILHTELGALTVQGRELHMSSLSLEGGRAELEGHISALIYEEPKSQTGWLGRLFG